MPSPHANSHTHEHTFVEWDVEAVDCTAYVYQPCEYVEITSAQTSARHDETFYGTGYECDASRTCTYELQRIERVSDGTTVVSRVAHLRNGDGQIRAIHNAVTDAFAERLTADRDDDSLTPVERVEYIVDYGNEQYCALYERTDVTIHEY